MHGVVDSLRLTAGGPVLSIGRPQVPLSGRSREITSSQLGTHLAG